MAEKLEQKLPQPSDAHRRLDAFVGKWHAEGESYAEGQRPDDPRASAVPWTSEETYEWLPGGFFLLHRWDAMAGERAFKGTEIIGYDEEGGYFTRFFDNAGNHPEYRATVNDAVWTFVSDRRAPQKTRSQNRERLLDAGQLRAGLLNVISSALNLQNATLR